MEPFIYKDIRRDFQISIDPDEINAEKRKVLYLQQRDILLKLAASKPQEYFDRAERYPAIECRDEVLEITWDLSKDYRLETVPSDIARSL
jgi:hypothetical protein